MIMIDLYIMQFLLYQKIFIEFISAGSLARWHAGGFRKQVITNPAEFTRPGSVGYQYFDTVMNVQERKYKVKDKFFLAILLILVVEVMAQQDNSPNLTGPYLGQKPPGTTARIFAPGVVSSQYFEHSSPAFTPDLKEIYWSTQIEVDGKEVAKPILFMKLSEGGWTKPAVPPFAKRFSTCENPSIAPNGKRLFFTVRDSLSPGKFEIWYVNREGDHWGTPVRMEEEINHKENGAFYPTIANDGTMYFMSLMKDTETGYGIFVSKFINGRYGKPMPIDKFNRFPAEFAPYIAPDQSYIIFCSFRDGGYGSGDLYICFKKRDGSWGEIVNMGKKINTVLNERFPNVSPDGKYFFFNSTRRIAGAKADEPGNGQGDVYWIDAKIIEELKPLE